MNSFADKVGKLCLQKYNSLKKTGKPTNNEWTVLSGIVLENTNGKLSVVSLATGTKCLGGSELLNTEIWKRGSRLSDSHAEILARRAFLRYLYDQLDLLLNDQKSDVFVLDSADKIDIKPGILFHFFSTQTPCGDCSIFPKEAKMLDEEINPPAKIRKISALSEASHDSSLNTTKNTCRIISDTYRTGAKCVSTEEKQDLLEPGINYHVLGSLRTKPGRGDPTLSLSCSDKLAKWNILGVQGSFLSLLIAPLRLESITIGGGCPFSQEAMERGLYKRFGNDVAGLKIFQAKESFIHLKGTLRTQPCPTSIIWCSVRNRELEVAVEGRKQGATKKKKGNLLLVSRRELLRIFLRIVEKYKGVDSEQRHPKKMRYYQFKQWSNFYQEAWKHLRLKKFHAWPTKPLELQDFIL